MRDGFPDLMLEKDGAVSFMEIKAEGDVIRRNQLTRLRQLGNAGIVAEIGRVDYRFDPEQDYVVVDVETTGGWASGDRITEIGAVKIRNRSETAFERARKELFEEGISESRMYLDPDRPGVEDIIDEIVAGIPASSHAVVERDADRRASIFRAIGLASPGDVVVIAGKGHEQGQEFENGRKEPFDDSAVAREAIAGLAS